MINTAFSPTKCLIDCGAIQRNFARLGKSASLMPVIKSDAYGHGLLEVAKALDVAGATSFAVGVPQEGAFLRQHGFFQALLPLMGCNDKKDWELVFSNNLIPLLRNKKDLEYVVQGATQKIPVAIKVDTGMSRLGFGQDEIPHLLEWLRQYKKIDPVYCITHLACADDTDKQEYTDNQQKIFYSIFETIRQKYPDIMPSMGNSALLIKNQEHGIYRAGLALYGGDPFFNSENFRQAIKLEWAMSVCSRIIAIRHLKPGQCVSYGATYQVKDEMKIAVVGIGYSQGYPRSLSGKTSALLHGKRIPQIGRICMGMSMFDITRIKNAAEGDFVWLVGGEGVEEPVTIQELADNAGTIPYELLCSFGSMNTRYTS